MLIPVTRRVRLRVSRPLWVEIDGAPQLEMTLPPSGREVRVFSTPEDYCLRTFNIGDEDRLLTLLQESGFTFTARRLTRALTTCLPDGCFVVEHLPSGVLAATMMARHFASINHLLVAGSTGLPQLRNIGETGSPLYVLAAPPGDLLTAAIVTSG